MTTTPAQTYAARNQSIDALIERLQAARQAHAQRAECKPGDWGFAGDLGRVEQSLVDLVESMGG